MSLPRLIWSDDIDKRVRTGDWEDQAVSTVAKVEEAVRSDRGEIAAELIDYFMEEAKVCHAIYKLWNGRFRDWLIEQGMDESEYDRAIAATTKLLELPDRRPFDPLTLWSELGAEAGRLAAAMRAGSAPADPLLDAVDSLREHWRQLHDRWVDLLSGVLTVVAERHGEAELEACYRYVLEPYIDERYMVYDLRDVDYEDTIYRNLYTTFEAMRGHLCGPGRRGDLEFEEHDDRWEVRFDPCGSGGRTVRGDEIEGTGPRPEPPYNFGVTTERYDWAWNETGICYYCAHCCLALERLPAERWGHPVRVVDPPRYLGERQPPEPSKCQWTVYKSVEAIPDKAYERIGLPAPPRNGSGDTTVS